MGKKKPERCESPAAAGSAPLNPNCEKNPAGPCSLSHSLIIHSVGRVGLVQKPPQPLGSKTSQELEDELNRESAR